MQGQEFWVSKWEKDGVGEKKDFCMILRDETNKI